MRLVCSLCLYDHKRPAREDDDLTVINGQLVCLDHALYVQGGTHAQAYALLRGQP